MGAANAGEGAGSRFGRGTASVGLGTGADAVSAPQAGLYRRLLGERLDALPPPLRALHERGGRQRYRGQAVVERGRGRLSRLCARLAGLPPAWQGAVEVEIQADPQGETWIRRFGPAQMRSHLRDDRGWVRERLGPMGFAFMLDAVDEVAVAADAGGAGDRRCEDAVEARGPGVVWRLARVSALGLPLPLRWFDGVRACEFQTQGRYGFEVSAALPLAGLLLRYRGWLSSEPVEDH